MQQLALPMSLPPVAPPSVLDRLEDDIDDAIDGLRREGWEFIGDDSCYCSVLLSPNGDRVLKLGSGCGAEATLNAALALPDNPHLPRVFGFKPLPHGNWWFAAEMEALEHLPDKDDWSSAGSFDDTAPPTGDRNNCPSFYRWQSSVSWKDNDRWRGPDLAAMPDGPLKDAFAALVDASDDYGGCSWDIHDGNIMVRPSDGAIVLNDLLA